MKPTIQPWAFLMVAALGASVWASDCDLGTVMAQLRPGSHWSATNNDPSTLNWLDNTAKPTATDIQAATTACQAAVITQQALKAQARLDVKNQSLTTDQRLNALLILLNLN